jgi:chemotaxis protein CheD
MAEASVMTESESMPERRIHKNPDDYFDNKFPETPLYVGPGDFECTIDPNVMLVSKVGSGVIICIHDCEIGVGGLVHVLLPAELLRSFPNFNPEDENFQQVEELIERFIRALKMHGAGKNRIRIKLYGGTSILEEFADSGLINFVFAKDYVVRKGLVVANVDIGGDECRRIHFHPASGKIERLKLRREGDIKALRDEETAFLQRHSKKKSG